MAGVDTPPFDPAHPDDPAWIAAQNAATGRWLDALPVLARSRAFMANNLPPQDPPWRCRRGQHLFELRRDRADGPNPALCVSRAGGGPRTLLDPNPEGLSIHPDHCALSPSGRYLACALAAAGEYLVTLRLLEVDSGAVVGELTHAGVQPRPAWLADDSGLVYSVCRRLFGLPPEPEDGLYRHLLGSDPASGECLASYADGAGHLLSGRVLAGWLLLESHNFSSSLSGFSCRPLDQPAATPTILFPELSTYAAWLGEAGGHWVFHTRDGAPNGRIVAIDPRRPGRAHWRELVPEGELALARPERLDAPPKHALGAEGLLLSYVRDACDLLRWHAADGRLLGEYALPVPSTIDAVYALDTGFEILSQSFLEPRRVMQLEAHAGLRTVTQIATPDISATHGEIRQRFCHRDDGTRIPMFVIGPAGRSAPAPVLLYGYGGFNQAITPEFHAEIALWLELGGTYVVANIRGGGEYGEAWHAAGSGLHKQNGFDDFHAVARDLLATGVASRVAAMGLSNGGLLTAVCVNQQPDLYAAVVSDVPLVDLMDQQGSPTGEAIAAEYGDPATDPAARAVIAGYSPLQNVRAGGPPQLVVVAEKDLSAPLGQACRYVAARQAAEAGMETPVLLRCVPGEAHSGWALATEADIRAEEIAFLWHFTRSEETA